MKKTNQSLMVVMIATMMGIVLKVIEKVRASRRGTEISFSARVSRRSYKKIGKNCRVLGGVVIGGNVTLNDYVSIAGPNTKVLARINSVCVGRFTSIGPGVHIQEYYHRSNRCSTYYFSRNVLGGKIEDDITSKGGITIQEDVWIGANSVILSGVTLGRGCIVGAGSVVTKDIPKYVVVGGTPAAQIRRRFKYRATEEFLEGLGWWRWSLGKIKKNHRMFFLEEDELVQYKPL